jgi:protein-tyrosine-phosphatase
MAMGLLKANLLDANDWKVESAGTWTIEGEAAAPRAIQVLREKGLDLDGHRSRMVTEELLSQFQLVLTMEAGHKEALKVEFPRYANRIYLLSEMIELKYDIEDPIGKSLQDYQETADEIEKILQKGMKRIEFLSRHTT